MPRNASITGSRKVEAGIEFRIDIDAMSKQLATAMKRFEERKLRRGIQKGLNEFGNAVVSDIKENAPAEHLKKSVKLYKTMEKRRGEYAIGIEIGSPDARAWEFGSGIHATKKEQQKYWIYARGARGGEGARLLSFDWDKSPTGKFVGVRVHHPGIKPVPYVYPAVRRQLRHINQYILKGIRSVK